MTAARTEGADAVCRVIDISHFSCVFTFPVEKNLSVNLASCKWKKYFQTAKQPDQLRIGSCLACVYRVMCAREKFGENERSFVSENFVSPRPLMFPSANIEDLGETKLTVSRGSSQKKKNIEKMICFN